MKSILSLLVSSVFLVNAVQASSIHTEIDSQCERLEESACHQNSACTWVGSSAVDLGIQDASAHCQLRTNDKLAAAKAKILERAKKKQQRVSKAASNSSEIRSTAQVSTVTHAGKHMGNSFSFRHNR